MDSCGLFSATPPLPHRVKPQLSLHILSCLQNQYYMRDTLPSSAANLRCDPYRSQLLCDDPEEVCLRKFHLNDPDFVLVTAEFSIAADNFNCFSEAKVQFQGCLSLVTADSSAPTDQKPQSLLF